MKNVTFTPIPRKVIEDRFKRGLYAIREQVKNDCNRYCKVDTGDTRDSATTIVKNAELEVWWNTPYAVYAWFTGKPNRGNAGYRKYRTASSGNPDAQLQWGEYAAEKHGDTWRRMIEKVMNDGR